MSHLAPEAPAGPAAASGWLRGFHPGWFGAVMGTAVVGVVAAQNPGGLGSLATTMKDLSIGATALGFLLGVLLGVPYLARWVVYPRAAWADLRDPAVGPLPGPSPAACSCSRSR